MRDNIKMAKLEREHSSGGIVIRDGSSGIKILLIKDPYGKWIWPKGKIDKGENPLEAAKREIGEEAGLKSIELISKIGETNYFYKRDAKLIYKTVFLYLFRSVGDENLKIQKSEIEDGEWLSENEALARLSYRGAKGLLKRAMAILRRAQNQTSKNTG